MHRNDLHEDEYELPEIPGSIDLIAFCQLRWNFVWQRPNHLMVRFAKTRRVFFVEEPILEDEREFLEITPTQHGVTVVTPHVLNIHASDPNSIRTILDPLFEKEKISDFMLWYWTPMAIAYTRHLKPVFTVYDCMDDLAHFASAPKYLREFELQLLSRADVVFTGGYSLYESRRYLHPNIHPFPSSIDRPHFEMAREIGEEPADQKIITGPKIGFFGVIDERLDQDLLRMIAALQPTWQFVMIGPVLKADPNSLPKAENIHWLGQKKYEELPAYLSGWDVAILPFAKNDATRNISPTKTPEYLAAGIPVVSTSIRDVVRPYGDMNLVWIADTAETFITCIQKALTQKDDTNWQMRVSSFLSSNSWDETWNAMHRLMSRSLKNRWLPARSPSAHSFANEAFIQEGTDV
jgi:glycosyltransferase involved in cell wall biosynthesis